MTHPVLTSVPGKPNLLLGGFYRWRTGRRDQKARMDEVFGIYPTRNEALSGER